MQAGFFATPGMTQLWRSAPFRLGEDRDHGGVRRTSVAAGRPSPLPLPQTQKRQWRYFLLRHA